MLLLIADIRLDERVRDPGLHSVQGTFKVSGLNVLSFDVLLQGQEGSLSAYCCYLGQETDRYSAVRRSVQPLDNTESRERAQLEVAPLYMCYGNSTVPYSLLYH